MNVVMGICGIGNGHTFRQLPVFLHLHKLGHSIIIFAYGASLEYYKKNHGNKPNVYIIEVANPYFVGRPNGLSFSDSLDRPENKKDFFAINCRAMAQADSIFNTTDIVISDYECVSAQYAYAKGAKLVTLDQQSKFLSGDFPRMLNGTGYIDEVERLRMFFPMAEKRLAISFFNVCPVPNNTHRVDFFPPIIRDEILALKNIQKSAKTSLLVYFTAQMPLEQSYDDMFTLFKALSKVDFHIMLPKNMALPDNTETVKFFHHGDSAYEMLLAQAHGVISTAGHTLLSEVLYLGKPIYAMPLPLYEQQINAKIIGDHGFGICQNNMTSVSLIRFIANLKDYENAIQNDQTVLLKGDGLKGIIRSIEEVMGLRQMSIRLVS